MYHNKIYNKDNKDDVINGDENTNNNRGSDENAERNIRGMNKRILHGMLIRCVVGMMLMKFLLFVIEPLGNGHQII